jgi:hypothetical protein
MNEERLPRKKMGRCPLGRRKINLEIMDAGSNNWIREKGINNKKWIDR